MFGAKTQNQGEKLIWQTQSCGRTVRHLTEPLLGMQNWHRAGITHQRVSRVKEKKKLQQNFSAIPELPTNKLFPVCP